MDAGQRVPESHINGRECDTDEALCPEQPEPLGEFLLDLGTFDLPAWAESKNLNDYKKRI